jgi:hypothetical protein
MGTVVVCGECKRKLDLASLAMRHHAGVMNRALERAHSGSLTEEDFKNFQSELWASLHDAETAWDTYREHLREHGILPAQK